MNKQTTKKDYEKPPKNNRSSNLVGFIIIFLGIAILLKNMNMGNIVPHWFFGWESILIIIGLVIGVNSKFEKKSAIILLVIGSVFFINNQLHISIGKFLIPVAAIGLGFYLINRNKQTPQMPPIPPENDDFDWDKRVEFPQSENPTTEESTIKNDPYTQPENAGYRNIP